LYPNRAFFVSFFLIFRLEPIFISIKAEFKFCQQVFSLFFFFLTEKPNYGIFPGPWRKPLFFYILATVQPWSSPFMPVTPVTIKEIAKIAGVCRATVDKVIHNRPGVKEKTRQRVKQVMSDLSYKPNIAGKALKLRGKKITIGVVLMNTDCLPFILTGIKEQLKSCEDFGLDTDIRIGDYPDADQQTAIREECIEPKIAGRMVSPFYHDKVFAAINHLAEKNIPVITVNTDLPDSARHCFIGQNTLRAGGTAAHLMAKFIGGRGKVAAITSSEENLSTTRRLQGFTELLERDYPEIHLVETVRAYEDPAVIYRETARLLHEYPALNGIFVTAGGVCEVGRAVSALGFTGKVSIISFDLYDDIRELVHQGVIDCTIGQDLHQQGAYPIQLFFQHFFYNQPIPRGEIFTPIDIRIRENIDHPLNC
jgi:LacI family transcriptional regulator